MTKITVIADCGNSPKMTFLKEFNIAFAKENTGFLVDSITDEVVWNIVGDKKITGKENFANELENKKKEKVVELELNQVLSHGKEGAANGIIKMQNGKKYAFSDFYQFKGAKGTKIKSITSYIIEIGK